MELQIGIASISESNLFLRCLWSQLRQKFGNCSWNFIPYKDGPNATIMFGYVSLGIDQPLLVSIKYKERGSISKIKFEAEKAIDSKTAKSIEECVELAKSSYLKPRKSDYSMQLQAISPWNGYSDFAVSHYSGSNFSIIPGDAGLVKLVLSIEAFDEVDAKNMTLRVCNTIKHLLTVSTNSVFEASNDSKFKQSECQNEVFNEDPEWMDGFSRVEDVLAISTTQKGIIENYIAGSLRHQEIIALASTHFFHALKLQLLSPHSLYEEVVSVLCVSALEVASLPYGPESKNCPACGNPVFAIRKRVLSLVEKHGGENLVKFIDSYYKTRSGFLHTGKLLSDRSYGGVSIPMLDNLSATGCVSQAPKPPVNLIEYTSYLLRKTFKDLCDEVPSS